MILFITPNNREKYKSVLHETYRLRKKIFVDKLKWDLFCRGDLEIDQFDHNESCYLVYFDANNEVKGCMRLTPTTSRNLTQEVFADHVPLSYKDANPSVWETSRFCIDSDASSSKNKKNLRQATYEVYTAMEEFALINNIDKLLFVASKPVERIMKQIGIPYWKSSDYFSTGDSNAFVGYFQPTHEQVENLMCNGNLDLSYQLNSPIHIK